MSDTIHHAGTAGSPGTFLSPASTVFPENKCPGERNPCSPIRRPRKSSCCLQLSPSDPVHYPDPAIYSQAEQLALGNIPDWDNPDITTNDWGPFRLKSEAQVVIHNLSPDVSAVNTLVNFSISSFGIAMPKTLIASKLISLAPASQMELLFPLPQDVLKGDQRIGVFINLQHPADSNYANNDGAQVHDGSYTTESGRNYAVSIPVYNDSNFSRAIQLSIMPTDIIASISPMTHLFAPHEQIIATLHIDVPGFLVGSSSSIISRGVTVVARLTTGELIGGATKLLRINN